MARALAFLAFLGAAFSWPEWYVDRAGLAALGFAFLSLAVAGRARNARPGRFAPRPSPWLGAMPDVAPVTRQLEDEDEPDA